MSVYCVLGSFHFTSFHVYNEPTKGCVKIPFYGCKVNSGRSSVTIPKDTQQVAEVGLQLTRQTGSRALIPPQRPPGWLSCQEPWDEKTLRLPCTRVFEHVTDHAAVCLAISSKLTLRTQKFLRAYPLKK